MQFYGISSISSKTNHSDFGAIQSRVAVGYRLLVKAWIHEAIVAAIVTATIAYSEYTRRRSPVGRHYDRHFDRQYDRRDDRLVYPLHYWTSDVRC